MQELKGESGKNRAMPKEERTLDFRRDGPSLDQRVAEEGDQQICEAKVTREQLRFRGGEARGEMLVERGVHGRAQQAKEEAHVARVREKGAAELLLWNVSWHQQAGRGVARADRRPRGS
jgi:hypothetical protein